MPTAHQDVTNFTDGTVPAQFTVESTLVNVIVPYGSSTGAIEVTTLKGTGSDGYFTVEP